MIIRHLVADAPALCHVQQQPWKMQPRIGVIAGQAEREGQGRRKSAECWLAATSVNRMRQKGIAGRKRAGREKKVDVAYRWECATPARVFCDGGQAKPHPPPILACSKSRVQQQISLAECR